MSSNEVDETGAYYTEWSKPERKTPIQYTNAYIWNLYRKMVTITLCMRQQKRHWCIEQSYGLCGRGRGWEDLRECVTVDCLHEEVGKRCFCLRLWILEGKTLADVSLSQFVLYSLPSHSLDLGYWYSPCFVLTLSSTASFLLPYLPIF